MHGHADELLGHFHGNFVVADEQELGLSAHARDQARVTLGIGIVQRRVDFVKQAKRSRVELKNSKHQGNRGERLLATREQLNGLIFFTRRLCNHLYARVKNFIARDGQSRITTTKQFGKGLAKVFVNAVECARQQLTGFTINFSNGVFQGAHGLVQIG